jgi:hypothetical protein
MNDTGGDTVIVEWSFFFRNDELTVGINQKRHKTPEKALNLIDFETCSAEQSIEKSSCYGVFHPDRRAWRESFPSQVFVDLKH